MGVVGYGTMGLSERRNARVTLTPQAPATTITISTATVTLFDTSGAVAGGVSGALASFDSGAQAAPRAWYQVKPTVLGIAPGTYTVAFLIVDSLGFEYEPEVRVIVVAYGG